MNRRSIKKHARENMVTSYVPWLIVSISGILLIYLCYGIFEGAIGKIFLRPLMIGLIALKIITLVPLKQLALDLTNRNYTTVEQSVLSRTKWFRNTVTILIMLIQLFLWSLLLIIPGIMKVYGYAFVPYILAENEKITPKDAIRLSQNLTYGSKWELFKLDLSFLFWEIANYFTFGLLAFFYVPHKNAAHAIYYNVIAYQNKYR